MTGPGRGAATGTRATRRVGVIIVAAGQSRRMVGVNKILAPLLGRPLVAYSVQAFQDSPEVDFIVLVMAPRQVDAGRHLARQYGWDKVVDVCAGGERRQDSVRRGMEALGDTKWTVVHDGARPCIDGDTLARGLAEASKSGAAVAAIPVKDTIKAVGPDMVVTGTPARDELWAVQTPQIFRTGLLEQAHREVAEDVTDDASMVERTGHPVTVFEGAYENIKVTSPDDLTVAEAILRARMGTVGSGHS